jgi:hypothetical protein
LRRFYLRWHLISFIIIWFLDSYLIKEMIAVNAVGSTGKVVGAQAQPALQRAAFAFGFVFSSR